MLCELCTHNSIHSWFMNAPKNLEFDKNHPLWVLECLLKGFANVTDNTKKMDQWFTRDRAIYCGFKDFASALIYDTVDHHILSSEIIALSTTNVSSILSKMLVTLLLLGLTFSSVFEASATGCGCAMDRVISNNPDRIPSRIPELFCRQAGMSCGNTFSKVSN